MMDNYYDEESLLLAPEHTSSRNATSFWTRRAALLTIALALVLCGTAAVALVPGVSLLDLEMNINDVNHHCNHHVQLSSHV